MQDLIQKIEDLLKAVASKQPGKTSLPTIPPIKQPSPPSIAPKKGGSDPKLPGIAPNGKKDPKKIAEQLKDGHMSTKNVEVLKFDKNGQWHIN